MKLENDKIENNLRIARTIKGFSQQGLAHSIDKSQTWIQQAEKGEVDFTISHINSICIALDIEPHFLLFSTPQQVFNNYNCKIGANGTFTNCNINETEFLDKISEIISFIKSRQ